jgi:hypothetical protein
VDARHVHPRRRPAPFRRLAPWLVALAAPLASAGAWRAQPFAEAVLTLRSSLGEVRFGAVVTGGRPTRLSKLTLAVDGKPLAVPAEIYREVVNPRVQETVALAPFDCSQGACETMAAVMIRYYPALGNPTLPKTAACASTWLRIVFDRQRVQGASILECLSSKHERERVVYRVEAESPAAPTGE